MSEVLKDPRQRATLVAMGVILMRGVYLLLLDDDPVPGPPQVGLEAGVVAEGGAMAGGSGVVMPPAAPCPSGFQPYGEVRAGQPVTCVPVPGSSSGDTSSGAAASSGGVIAT